ASLPQFAQVGAVVLGQRLGGRGHYLEQGAGGGRDILLPDADQRIEGEGVLRRVGGQFGDPADGTHGRAAEVARRRLGRGRTRRRGGRLARSRLGCRCLGCGGLAARGGGRLAR